MSDLRSSVIRLAHTRPELRPHLLPLLKTSGKVDTLLSQSNHTLLNPETQEKIRIPFHVLDMFRTGSNRLIKTNLWSGENVAVSDSAFESLRRYAVRSKNGSFHSKIVRLAYSRPDLRPHLLPLLSEPRTAGLFVNVRGKTSSMKRA